MQVQHTVRTAFVIYQEPLITKIQPVKTTTIDLRDEVPLTSHIKSTINSKCSK